MRAYSKILFIVLSTYVIHNNAVSGVVRISINKTGQGILRNYQRIATSIFSNSFSPASQDLFHLTLHHVLRYREELINAAITTAATEEAINRVTLANKVTVLNTPSHRVALVIKIDRSTTQEDDAANRLKHLAKQLRTAVTDVKNLRTCGPTMLPFMPHVTLGYIDQSALSKNGLKKRLNAVNALLTAQRKVLIDVTALNVFQARQLEATVLLRK